MKILFQPKGAENIIEVYKKAGYETTIDPTDNFDYFFPGHIEIGAKQIKAAQELNPIVADNHIKPDMLYKDGLSNCVAAAGLESIPWHDEASNEVLNTFYKKTPFIIKPKLGAGAFSKYPHVYKIYENAQSLYDDIGENNAFFIEDYKNHIVQDSVQRSDGTTNLLFTFGYINSKSEFYHEGITLHTMIRDSSHDAIGMQLTPYQALVPSKFKHLETAIRNSADKSDQYRFLEQVGKLIKFHGLKSVPFQAQALLSSDGYTCYISDWAFRFTEYMLNTNGSNDYIIDKINYMYENGYEVRLHNDNFYSYITVDTPRGISKDVYNYCVKNDIHIQGYGEENYSKILSLRYLFIAKTKNELEFKVRDLKAYIASL